MTPDRRPLRPLCAYKTGVVVAEATGVPESMWWGIESHLLATLVNTGPGEGVAHLLRVSLYRKLRNERRHHDE